MVTLPPNFMATKFPGYFWNVESKQLFSIKVGGVLRPLKLTKPSYWNKLWCPAYRISVQGVDRWLTTDYLNKLQYRDSTIGVAL